jgi:hypothetical protein
MIHCTTSTESIISTGLYGKVKTFKNDDFSNHGMAWYGFVGQYSFCVSPS